MNKPNQADKTTGLPQLDSPSHCLSVFGDQIQRFHIGCVCMDPESTEIQCVNATFLELLGRRREFAIGAYLTDFLPEQTHPLLLKELRFVNKNVETTRCMELRLKSEGDTERWAQLNFTSRQFGTGTQRTIMATAIEITERRSHEKELRLLCDRFEIAEQHSKLGSWESSAEVPTIWWSKQLYDLHRTDPAFGPLEIHEFIQRVHPDDRESLLATYATPLAIGAQREVQYRSNPDLGPIRTFLSRIYATKKRGKLTWNGTTQDISEREQIHTALQESKRKYREIVESAADAICVVSPTFFILDINEPAAKMLGYEAHELIGTSILELKDAESLKKASRTSDQRNLKVARVYETNFRRRDGKEIWVIISACPLLDENGDLVSTKGTMIEITHRKQIEKVARDAAISKAKLEMLSTRERFVLSHVVAGSKNREIAMKLDISEKTVERHRASLMKKLKAKSVVDLVRISVIAEAGDSESSP